MSDPPIRLRIPTDAQRRDQGRLVAAARRLAALGRVGSLRVLRELAASECPVPEDRFYPLLARSVSALARRGYVCCVTDDRGRRTWALTADGLAAWGAARAFLD
jgi:hypothetical protein